MFSVLAALVVAVSGVRADDPKIEWTHNYDVAVKRMEKAKKPILLLFTDPVACPPCKRMDKETWTDPRVIKATGDFVCCKLETTADRNTGVILKAHTQEILDRFASWQQPVRGWPSVRFFKANKKPMPCPDAGFMTPDDLFEWMKKTREDK